MCIFTDVIKDPYGRLKKAVSLLIFAFWNKSGKLTAYNTGFPVVWFVLVAFLEQAMMKNKVINPIKLYMRHFFPNIAIDLLKNVTNKKQPPS